jgi:hypothetical protein
VANAWDDFWGNLNKTARTHPLVAGAMDGIGEINKGMGKVVYNGPREGSPHGTIDLEGGTWGQPQAQQAVNTSRLPGMSQDNSLAAIHGKFNTPNNGKLPGDYPRAAPDPMDKLMQRRAELERMLDEDFTGDPEVDALIEQAYTSALSNVAGARTRANDNFKQSDANIDALSRGHVAAIEGEDRQAIQRIGGELQGKYQNTFDTAKGSLEADRNAELQERTAMLQRLGIQEAGLGEAGQDESQAISNLTQNQAGAMKQAQGYQAADEVRNVEQAQSQASAGVERRSALNKDLQGILGKLDESEVELQNSKASAQLQAKQAGKSDYNNRLKTISDSIDNIDDRIDSRTDSDRDYSLEMQKLAQKGTGSGGVFNAVENNLRNRGIDPAQYTQTYADVASNETFNAAVDGDKKLWMIRKMKAKNPKLDAREIQAYVLGVENYGTDKL